MFLRAQLKREENKNYSFNAKDIYILYGKTFVVSAILIYLQVFGNSLTRENYIF